MRSCTRKGRSTQQRIAGQSHDLLSLLSSLQEGKQVDVLVMDFAKAFDKVYYSFMVHKLCHYGIQGKVNRCIKNWLADRKHTVVVEGEKSHFVSVDSGVPVSSVLGPGLFLYYINDLPAKLNSNVRLLNMMRQSACLVFNPIMVNIFASLFNCTPVGRASDSVMAPT